MNKITLLAAAIAVGVAPLAAKSDVVSKNICGYHNFEIGCYETAASLPDFLNLKNAEAVALNDITPVSVKGNPFNSGNFYLIPVGTDQGNPMLIGECDWLWDDEELNKLEGWEDFLMANEDQDIGFCYVGGKWYLTTDVELKYEVGRYEFAAGFGFIVSVGTAHKGGVNLTYSGSVADEDFPVEIGCYETALSGNFAPTEMALSEFVPTSIKGNPFNSGNFYLIPIGTDQGNPMLIGECDWLWDDEELNKLEGWEDFLMENEGQDIGLCYVNNKWYLTTDVELKYEVSRFPFKAGEGFIVSVGTAHKGGVEILLPNALN